MKNKFKVGDKVKLNPNKEDYYYGIGNVRKGEVGKIYEIDGDKYYVAFPRHSDWEGRDDDCILANIIKKLSDLQFADILTLKNDERYVVADGCMLGEDDDYYCDTDEIEDYYNDDLTRDSDDEDDRQYDIVKIERAGQVVFEREKAVEMTITEISKKLGYEIKVVKEK